MALKRVKGHVMRFDLKEGIGLVGLIDDHCKTVVEYDSFRFKSYKQPQVGDPVYVRMTEDGKVHSVTPARG